MQKVQRAHLVALRSLNHALGFKLGVPRLFDPIKVLKRDELEVGFVFDNTLNGEFQHVSVVARLRPCIYFLRKDLEPQTVNFLGLIVTDPAREFLRLIQNCGAQVEMCGNVCSFALDAGQLTRLLINRLPRRSLSASELVLSPY